jgi:hypothetical protein
LGNFWNLAFQITQQPIELPAVDTPSRETFYGYVFASYSNPFSFKINVTVNIQQAWKHGCCFPLFACRHFVCQLAILSTGLCLSNNSGLAHQRGL